MGHGILGPGASPVIQFEASDDYGLTKVAVEQIDTDSPAGDQDAPGKVIQEWPIDNQRELTTTWTGDGLRPMVGQTTCFRVVAYDNFAGAKPHRSVSPAIVFQTADPKDLSGGRGEDGRRDAGHARQDGRVAKREPRAHPGLQRAGGRRDAGSMGRRARRAGAGPRHHRHPHLRPAQAARLAPAEGRAALLTHEMLQTQSICSRTRPTAEAGSKAGLLARRRSRRRISFSTSSPAWTRHLPRPTATGACSDILALMDGLVHDQTELNTATAAAASAGRNATLAPLTKKQDRLSGDADAFVSTATAEAANMKGTDAAFADVLGKVAAGVRRRGTSRRTCCGRPSNSTTRRRRRPQPIQDGVLKNLADLQAMLNAWRADSAAARAAEMLAAFQKAEDKLQRLDAMQQKVLQSMKQWKAKKDATTADESDGHEELEKKDEAMKEAMFQIAADLQIFPEAQLGNEVVKDVTTTFAKVDQITGASTARPRSATCKRRIGCSRTSTRWPTRIKDGIPTLPNAPTNANFTTEDFDKQEFPGAVAAVPLADKFDDLIGDLLKLDQSIADKTQSSATNQAFKDMYMEGPVAEGEWANYSAKGKSGNNVPKDNEQSGRSNVGRQGMSDGETAAATGKINQGDDDIKKRMTEDAAQSGEMGKIDDSLAKTVATGGGKLSGNADDYGMSGAGPRRDAKDGSGGDGMAALLKKRADAIYAAASLEHVRTGSLDEAIMHLRDADEAQQEGRPIEEVRELSPAGDRGVEEIAGRIARRHGHRVHRQQRHAQGQYAGGFRRGG